MQAKSIIINSSKVVQAKDGSEVEIHKLKNGVFQIDNYVASQVFVLMGQKNILLACGVNFCFTDDNPIAGDPVRGLVCRFEIDLDTLVDFIPPTPAMTTPSASQDSQLTQSL